jgi:hypothetical protein
MRDPVSSHHDPSSCSDLELSNARHGMGFPNTKSADFMRTVSSVVDYPRNAALLPIEPEIEKSTHQLTRMLLADHPRHALTPLMSISRHHQHACIAHSSVLETERAKPVLRQRVLETERSKTGLGWLELSTHAALGTEATWTGFGLT